MALEEFARSTEVDGLLTDIDKLVRLKAELSINAKRREEERMYEQGVVPPPTWKDALGCLIIPVITVAAVVCGANKLRKLFYARTPRS